MILGLHWKEDAHIASVQMSEDFLWELDRRSEEIILDSGVLFLIEIAKSHFVEPLYGHCSCSVAFFLPELAGVQLKPVNQYVAEGFLF